MFSMRPEMPWPGFRFEAPEEEEVPGFRMNADGSVGKATPPAGEARVSNLLFDPATAQPAMPVSCQSLNGELNCTTPGGTSFGPLPAPKGFPNITPDDGSRHEYRYESDPIYNPKEVMRQVIERPTLGPGDLNSPATPEGTRNEATPQPYYSLAEALKAASGMWGLSLGPVKSHVTTDQDGNTVVVNVTEPGHRLFPGYVVHRIVKEDDGSYRLVTEGEGLGALQSPQSPEMVRDLLNRQTWQEYHKRMLERAKPR